MKAMLFQRPIRRVSTTQQGFTLIEMLIALVIFVIALLAIGLLQLRGIAMTRDANMRTTAIFAARSLGEAIKANYPARYAFAPGNAGPAAVAQCKVTFARNISFANNCVCDRVTADIRRVFDITTNLPEPVGANLGKIEVEALPMRAGTAAAPTSFLAPPTCAALEGQAYRINIRWSEGTGAIGIQNQLVSLVVMP